YRSAAWPKLLDIGDQRVLLNSFLDIRNIVRGRSLVYIAKITQDRLEGIHHIDSRWNIRSRFFSHLDSGQLLNRSLLRVGEVVCIRWRDLHDASQQQF